MTKPNDYGKFTRYQPDLPASDPRVIMGVIWLKNEAGADWYELQKTLPGSGTYLTVEDSGRIRTSSPDPSRLIPDGLRVVRIAGTVANADLEGKRIDLETGALSDPPPAVPAMISDRQFFQQLAAEGLITQAEALAAVRTGDLPVALRNIVDSISDPQQRFAAEMLLSGATDIQRSHPLTDAIGAATGRTSAQIDDFFRAAAAL